jgi:hypothetical protein
MLLYKTTYQTKVTDIDQMKIVKTHAKWHGSAKDAGSYRAKCRKLDDYIPNSIQSQKIVVPSDKKGLLSFLNSDFINKGG